MLYIIKAAITLALLYSCFFLFLSKETFHRFNRIMLVGIMLVSLIMPLFHFTTSHPTALNEEVYMMQNYIETNATPIVVTAEHTRSITWMQALTGLFLTGVAVMIILTSVQAVSLIRFMRGGVRHTDSQGNTVILHNSDVPPFSIFRYIVMSVKDYETSRRYILTHEQEHIRLGHSYDLLLLQCVRTLQWFNPFIWFLSRDLKAVHEYEADQAVINQGIDAKSYQQLLVMKVVGDRLQPFTNNLNHGSLKKRIVMMYQRPSNRWLMLKALCAIPVVALTLNAFATPIETDPVEDMVKTLKKQEVPTFNEVKETVLTTEVAKQDGLDNLSSTVVNRNTTIDDEPLLVLDGKIVELPANLQNKKKNLDDEDVLAQLFGIKKDDIASITVLKDGAATAIYGDKGKNGVIEIKTKKQQEEDDPIFDVCEETASYPGGQGALMQYLAQNVRYPQTAMEHGVQGRVLVQFVVEKDGSRSNYKIVRSTSNSIKYDGITVTAQGNASEQEKGNQEGAQALESESIRVIKSMPNWIPAKQRGQEVRMRYTLPITFRLQ